LTDVSEVLPAFIIRAIIALMMQAVSSSESSTRLHGATTQKTAIFENSAYYEPGKTIY
jgi:hypothetical protein